MAGACEVGCVEVSRDKVHAQNVRGGLGEESGAEVEAGRGGLALGDATVGVVEAGGEREVSWGRKRG